MTGASTVLPWLYQFLALVLLCNLISGLARVLRGPTLFDRMIAAQFFGTVGVGFLLLLGKGAQLAALRDVALVLAILTPVATVAFVRAQEKTENTEETEQ